MYWFFSAPDIRFGYGYLIFLFLAVVVLTLRLAQSLVRFHPTTLSWILLGGLILYQGSVLVRAANLRSLPQRWIVPLDYMSLPSKPCELYNTRIWCSDGYPACYYEPFPCVPGADPRVGLRGSDWGEGFRYFPQE